MKISHQYRGNDECFILQAFNDLGINVAEASCKIDAFGAIPRANFFQSLFAVQLYNVQGEI